MKSNSKPIVIIVLILNSPIRTGSSIFEGALGNGFTVKKDGLVDISLTSVLLKKPLPACK